MNKPCKRGEKNANFHKINIPYFFAAFNELHFPFFLTTQSRFAGYVGLFIDDRVGKICRVTARRQLNMAKTSDGVVRFGIFRNRPYLAIFEFASAKGPVFVSKNRYRHN